VLNYFRSNIWLSKACWKAIYFLGVWSRGMSKSYTTGIYAVLDAILNQGVETGILSRSFRQSKMIFKKIEVYCRQA